MPAGFVVLLATVVRLLGALPIRSTRKESTMKMTRRLARKLAFLVMEDRNDEKWPKVVAESKERKVK